MRVNNILIKGGILILLFCIPNYFYGSGIRYKGQYIPIQTLSGNDCQRYVCLDIKKKEISFSMDNQTTTFIQENILDSAQLFTVQNLICKNEKEYISLQISELKRIDADSIYVSASYQRFNEKGNIGKTVKIGDLGIPKSELAGVVVSPPIREIKKGNRVFGWFVGASAVTITTLSLIFAK